MYILQNAWKSISRNLARNVLICLITLIIAASVCVALSIREASETTKEDTLSNLSVTAQISYDRTQAMKEMSANIGDRTSASSFDFEALQGETLTLDDYLYYTQALSDGDGYYYSEAISLNASDGVTPYGESAEETTSTATTGSMPGMTGGLDMTSQGDFTVTGYSSYDALMSLFGSDGTHSIQEGAVFDSSSADMKCLISDELALQNDLSVGDSITLTNPSADTETYTLTVCGIYNNNSSGSQEVMRFASDPANDIYTSHATVEQVIQASTETASTVQNDDGTEEAANIEGTTTFTYVFASAENYYQFEDQVYELGLGEDYLVSSSDLSTFESSLVPLESLSTMASWFLVIVLVVGGVILVGLSILNLRERKYEIGVLTAIGMKKGKVAMQYVSEAFIVTCVGILLGAVIGACLSVPVTNELLASQIESTQASSQQIAGNFGVAPEGFSGTQSLGGNTGPMMPGAEQTGGAQVDYIDSISSATNIFVIAQLLGVGLLLTFVSSIAAMVTIMRYDPLRILSSRS